MTFYETRPIIALDFPNEEKVNEFLVHFPSEESLFLKVGMEIFYKEGPTIVHNLKAKGHSVFLDLKLHDIPNTVECAMRNIAKLDVDITNLHAAGGTKMMKAAQKGLITGTKDNHKPPLLIAVTQLTSTTQEEMQVEQRIGLTMEESVINYAKNTQLAGLQGVVCSALEVEKIKQATDENFICLTPGIRPAGANLGDQMRVVTPKKARQIGSTHIVVGRPITQAKNPYEMYLSIKKEWTD
jgi:orotidine-5'-phosphate decarboxylase